MDINTNVSNIVIPSAENIIGYSSIERDYIIFLPILDTYLNELANYIKTEVNIIAQARYNFKSNNPIIKTYYLYDGFNIPLQDFPVLKVYRQIDTITAETYKSESNIMISYSVVIPKQERIVGQCYIVGRIIHEVCNNLLAKKGIDVINQVRRRIEYRTTINEINQAVIGIITYPLVVRETLIPKEQINNKRTQ
jgi:hypothetical protein